MLSSLEHWLYWLSDEDVEAEMEGKPVKSRLTSFDLVCLDWLTSDDGKIGERSILVLPQLIAFVYRNWGDKRTKSGNRSDLVEIGSNVTSKRCRDVVWCMMIGGSAFAITTISWTLTFQSLQGPATVIWWDISEERQREEQWACVCNLRFSKWSPYRSSTSDRMLMKLNIHSTAKGRKNQ